MLAGIIGLGSVIETAYLPALRRISPPALELYGYDADATRQPDGINRCDSLDALLALPLDVVLITTSSLHHLPVLERVLQSEVPAIVVEKPVAATLAQLEKLETLLKEPHSAARVLALDHWMVRTQACDYIRNINEISRIEGFLREPSGFNAAGEPIALNFATGEADTRQLRHPDGVIVDIGTHVLAMMRETVHHVGGNDRLTIKLNYAHDRLGNAVAPGDVTTAEGEALLTGTISDIPFTLHLNKYAGPAGGQKGMRIYLHDGRIINIDREGANEVVELMTGVSTERKLIAGPLYDRCLNDVVFGENRVFLRTPDEVPAYTQRRLTEVTALLELQQQLRGKH
ncbi:Gfo/Idh/MocA family oxidoreductase [Buttiauxella selenatireducens]|uniref:Gfo/Idh/MocA family oxidoreductase n=1 Tax=Buttiauxella selenatireducens TaxID=3073902 RepID=A0ABY9S8Q4_9ENTR|nr:Gfo/Idh/MocA family oxidoreductase [Buttiauxella sp. R73]WMY72816.1 Gfo/Idh/MocA family oxidoreductase [Buttiauxella sp. R73]